MAELNSTISARELAEWQAFYRMDPWGEQRADLRMGILASTLANIFRKRGTPYIAPERFLPFAREPRGTPQTLDQMRGILKRFAQTYRKVQNNG